MNRKNLKIVIALFLTAAAATWFTGHLKYSRPGPEEQYCWNRNQYLSNNYRTNLGAVGDQIIDTQTQIRDNPNSSYSEKLAANLTIRRATQSQIEALDEINGWSKQERDLSLNRAALQSHYNLAAEILIAISATLGLLLFITQPSKT
jgi:hypothetical protein